MLGIFGEADHVISLADVRRLRDSFDRHDKSYTIKVYPGAPHGWLNDTMPGRYRRDAAEAAWAFQLAFLKKVLDPRYDKIAPRADLRIRARRRLRFLQERPFGVARSPGMYNRLLFAIVTTAFVEQIVITIARVATTYRAVELGLSVVWLGIITAAYALLPIAIGVPIGRFIDRGYDAVTTWIGAGLLIVACAGFVLFPNLVGILISTALLGTAHLLFVISQQIQCTRCGTGPGAMERAIGNYMVANAAGQGVGPYIVALAGGSASVPPTHLLFLISIGGAVLTAALSPC